LTLPVRSDMNCAAIPIATRLVSADVVETLDDVAIEKQYCFRKRISVSTRLVSAGIV
jgi:hypothetical protein